MQTYTIRPLRWSGSTREEFGSARAAVPFGSYYVTRTDDGLRWGYCFDEYYDEDEFPCDTVAEGKRLAWQNWVERIGGALKAVESGKRPTTGQS